MGRSSSEIITLIEKQTLRSDIPDFKVGDSVKVHAKIVEGTKERVQIFEGLVIRRASGNQACATFTVRKVSYNVGVERTFLLHSPRIEKIELTARGKVRRSRLYYLRNLRGKASRIDSENVEAAEEAPKTQGAEKKSTAVANKTDKKGAEGLEAATA